MRVCTKDSKHKKFTVSAWESHNWIVDENGEFIEDRGCYDSAIAEGSEWLCAQCGADTRIVKTVAELSGIEAKEKLSKLRSLCLALVKAQGNYNYQLRDDLVGQIHEEVLQLHGE